MTYDPVIAKLFFLGVAIGSTWEFAFDVLGESFCTVLCEPLLWVPGTRGVAHSIHDGVLFVVGV